MLSFSRPRFSTISVCGSRQSRPLRATNTKAEGGAPKPTPSSTKKGEGEDYAMTLPGKAPWGYLDPFKLARSVSPGEVKRWRESELIHGRISMLAAVGWLVGESEGVEKNPLFNGAVSGPALRQFQQVEAQNGLFWELLVVVISIAEVYRALYGWRSPIGGGANVLKEDYQPGNIGWDPLGLKPDNEPEFILMQDKEINNGRLAMIGIAGMVAQEEVDNLKVLDHFSQFGFAMHG